MMHQSPLPHLIVIQSNATQFDGPFFRYLSTRDSFRLSVFYTSAPDAIRPFDPELNRCPDWNHDAISGYAFHVYPGRLLERLKTSAALVWSRPALIIMGGWRSPDNLVVLFLARLFRVPVGIRADNNRDDSSVHDSWKLRLRRFARNRILSLFSTGHPVGTLAASYMTEGGVRPSRLFPFPYLVDETYLRGRYGTALAGKDLLRANYAIPADDFVVLGIMKFVEREDPLTLVKAFAMLSRQNTGVHLVLVGDGPLRPAIEKLLEDEKLANVTLPGYVSYSKLPEFFSISNLLVHPAREESWGVTVNEALVCGLPVITADTVGSSIDLIEAGVNGFTFPCGDAKALSDLLGRILAEPALQQSLKVRCREPRGLHRFTYAVTEANLLRAIQLVSSHQVLNG
jgi:glycosyltransferase involved in cell wall biosynthesis